ncbi:MAG: Signal transduction histidine-protein kinase BarA [Chloroflexi bacterium ADurb.Bin325]|nr:MAG: Signal transduction histidine-protein kinase BarA [Chloroflexi bacterium ADurb.Bin325]
MYYSPPTLAHADPEFVGSAQELLRSTARTLVIATLGLLALTLGLMWVKPPAEHDVTAIPLLVLAALVGVAVLWLLDRRLLLAMIVWQSALAALLWLAIVQFHEPLLAFAYALFPLLAAVTLGWPAALVAEAGVLAIAWWFSLGHAGVTLPPEHARGIVIGGLITGALGWASVRALYTVTAWSIYSFHQAQERLEEARNQRVEFRQTEEDLVQANRELARLSDRLKAMYQVAEDARRTKEEFVANVSHELRTPLNMIIGFSEMITQTPGVYGEAVPSALLADIAAIQRNSQHLARLVDDVLNLSQVEAGRMMLTKEWTSLAEIVEAACIAVRALYESKGLRLRTNIPADLPPVFCDATRIRQVVLNLISNAGRFTQRGGVEIAAWVEGGHIAVCVTDSGPGIRAEDQHRVFEPFQQVDASLRREHGGTGLGLTISKRFVEMHEGKMWLESPAHPAGVSDGGPGTRFCFTLPLDTPASVLSGHTAAGVRWLSPYQAYEERTRPSKAALGPLAPRYVVVEPDARLVQRFREALDQAEVVQALTLAEGRRELERSPARALIINTTSLPDNSPSAEDLAGLPYNTPAIICSMPAENEAAQKMGVVRYLVKPITRAALLDALAELGPDVHNILLVDDEPEILRLFTRVLSSSERGYRVWRATDGQRGLDLLRQRRPDAVLLDLILPGLDGYRVLRAKNTDPDLRDIPVIVISSRDPGGQPIVSDQMTITRPGGLSLRDLAACVAGVSEVLAGGATKEERTTSDA